MTTKDKTKPTVLKRISVFAVMAAVVIADQLTKLAASRALLRVGESRTAIPGVLDFTYVLNSGATAGILADRRWVFMVVSTVVIAVLVVCIALGKFRNTFTAFSIGMIVGGGIGNMIDRVANGKVVDFLDVTCFDFFPFNTVFNVADVFVCVGCALLILSVIIEEIKERGEKKKACEGAESSVAQPDGTAEEQLSDGDESKTE